MYNLKVERKEEVVFSDLILNDKEELEFTYVNSKSLLDFKSIFNDKKGSLELIDSEGSSTFINISEEDRSELEKIKEMARKEIITMYTDILNDKEKLLFLEVGLEEHPYLITTKTMLNTQFKSPKFHNALLFVFSDKILKPNNKRINFEFKDYEDFQSVLGRKIKKEKVEKNFDLDGEKVIGLKWSDIVQ